MVNVLQALRQGMYIMEYSHTATEYVHQQTQNLIKTAFASLQQRKLISCACWLNCAVTQLVVLHVTCTVFLTDVCDCYVLVADSVFIVSHLSKFSVVIQIFLFPFICYLLLSHVRWVLSPHALSCQFLFSQRFEMIVYLLKYLLTYLLLYSILRTI